MAAGLDVANEVGETFGEPAEHKKGATHLFCGSVARGSWFVDRFDKLIRFIKLIGLIVSCSVSVVFSFGFQL